MAKTDTRNPLRHLPIPLLLLAVFMATMLPDSAFSAGQETFEGRLVVHVADDFAGNRAEYLYYLKTGEREQIKLDFGSERPSAPPGARIRVRGTLDGETLSVGSIDLQSPESDDGPAPSRRSGTPRSPEPRSKKVAVVLLNFLNSQNEPWSLEETRRRVFTNSSSVSSYYRENSSGLISLRGKLRADGDVFGWYTVPYNRSGSCDYNRWSTAARMQAEYEGHDLTGYDHIIYAWPDAGCWWAGLGEVGGSTSWIDGNPGGSVAAHELGHNFGLLHASSYWCYDSNDDPVAISDDCDTREYGDPYDVMGSWCFCHNSNYHKGRLGFLPPENTLTVTSTDRYTLLPSEERLADGSVQALRVPRKRNWDGSIHDYYYLDFRQSFGAFDNFAGTGSEPVTNGVTVRIAPDYDDYYSRTLLLRTNPVPSWDSTFILYPLPAGGSFSDPDTGVTVTTRAVSPLGATVEIEFFPGTLTPSPPSNLTASAQSSREVRLSWDSSIDNDGVSHYTVFRDGDAIDTTSDPGYMDSYLTPETTYTYHVVAHDYFGNSSDRSNEATVTTSAEPEDPGSEDPGKGGSAPPPTASYPPPLSRIAPSQPTGTSPPPTLRVKRPRKGKRYRQRALRKLYGSATSDSQVVMVRYALARRSSLKKRVGGKLRRRVLCRFIGSSGKLARKRRSCKRRKFLKARGTSSWRIALKRRPPRGRYTLYVTATDSLGDTSKLTRVSFRVV